MRRTRFQVEFLQVLLHDGGSVTLAIGSILENRYRVVKLVGQGGFGAVYRGWHIALDQPVAIKENVDTGPESQRQFEREARLLAGLHHPNLPRVSDHFVVPGQGQYLVMDFVEGRSLRDLLDARGRPLDEAEVLPWIRQVCDALDFLHSRTPPIIHRDVKPGNIIIAPDGRAVLVDFGISKILDPGKGTTVGARGVTPGYSPPEQYGRGRTDVRSDVYALGATLYTLLTGQPPPDGPDLASGADVLTPPRQANPTVSAATSAAVMAAMAPTISQRLGGVAAFAKLLPVATAPATVRTPPAVAPTMPSASGGPGKPAARRGVPVWGWIAGVIALVALAVWAGIAFSGRDGVRGEATPEATAGIEIVVADTTRPAATDVTPIPTVASSPTPRPDPSPSATATSSPTPTAEPQAGHTRTVTRGGVEVEQVFVPAGSFLMGSEDGWVAEQPVHEVMLDAFWIDRMEVTNAQFSAFVQDTEYKTVGELESTGHQWITQAMYGMSSEGFDWKHPHGRDSSIVGLDQHPVVQVTWEDAAAYCVWAEGRLPTEAEWEYAARGPEGVVYPWGNQFDGTKLNYCDRNCPKDWYLNDFDDGYPLIAAVASYPQGSSWVSALDMLGNVSEWVNDLYDQEFYARLLGDNPTGPLEGTNHVLRGGAWNDWGRYQTYTRAWSHAPLDRGEGIGFRCVQDSVDLDGSQPVPTPSNFSTTSTPTPMPKLGDSRTVMRGGVEVEQVYAPAGSFVMGSESGDSPNEKPDHGVTLDAFWIDRTEVTNAQYEACVAAEACRPPAQRRSLTRGTYYDDFRYVNYPVIYVSWEDAVAFAAWASGRLPTEAEWEYAARGPESHMYPWGNEVPTCSLLNFNSCVGDTTEVGIYSDGASWLGALDMAGNVWEWVNDWYGENYYALSAGDNPTGPQTGAYRVSRGGAWNYNEQYTSAALRFYRTPTSMDSNVGFRVVEPVSDPDS